MEGPEVIGDSIRIDTGGESHTIYYDCHGKPFVYRPQLPKQVLFLEQFLRLTHAGGKVFTVLDIGPLNNVGDDYVRRYLLEHARIHAVVELVHGAFKAADANVRTVILLYEKRTSKPELDYQVFVSIPQYLGYRLNDQNVPLILENDLGKVLCEYVKSLTGGVPCCSEVDCDWRRTRRCKHWSLVVDPSKESSVSERQKVDQTLLSTSVPIERAAKERRLDPKFYVYEKRFDEMAKRFLGEQVVVRPLSDLTITPIHRGVQPQYVHDGTIPVLKTANIQNKKIDWGECLKVSEAFLKRYERGRLSPGDIVVTSTGEGSWGRAAIVDRPCALADGHLTILRLDTGIIDPYVALAFLWSDYGSMQFEQRVRGSTGQTEIYPEDIGRIRVLVPNEHDQKSIRNKVLHQFRLVDAAESLRAEIIQDVRRLLGE